MDLSPSEPSSIYRHLTLFDLICLVLAVAAGLAACRFVQRVEVVLFPAELGVMDLNAWVGMGSTLALVLAWMVVLRGASWGRSERLQFGYLGCLAVVVASGRMFLSNLSMTWRGWFSAEPVSIGSRADSSPDDDLSRQSDLDHFRGHDELDRFLLDGRLEVTDRGSGLSTHRDILAVSGVLLCRPGLTE